METKSEFKVEANATYKLVKNGDVVSKASKNLVTDKGYDLFRMITNTLNIMQVGTGTTAPAALDTALEVELDSSYGTQQASTIDWNYGATQALGHDALKLSSRYKAEINGIEGLVTEVGASHLTGVDQDPTWAINDKLDTAVKFGDKVLLTYGSRIISTHDIIDGELRVATQTTAGGHLFLNLNYGHYTGAKFIYRRGARYYYISSSPLGPFTQKYESTLHIGQDAKFATVGTTTYAFTDTGLYTSSYDDLLTWVQVATGNWEVQGLTRTDDGRVLYRLTSQYNRLYMLELVNYTSSIIFTGGGYINYIHESGGVAWVLLNISGSYKLFRLDINTGSSASIAAVTLRSSEYVKGFIGEGAKLNIITTFNGQTYNKFFDMSKSALASRALVKDEQGLPIGVDVTLQDTLELYYDIEVIVHAPPALTLAGVTKDYHHHTQHAIPEVGGTAPGGGSLAVGPATIDMYVSLDWNASDLRTIITSGKSVSSIGELAVVRSEVDPKLESDINDTTSFLNSGLIVTTPTVDRVGHTLSTTLGETINSCSVSRNLALSTSSENDVSWTDSNSVVHQGIQYLHDFPSQDGTTFLHPFSTKLIIDPPIMKESIHTVTINYSITLTWSKLV